MLSLLGTEELKVNFFVINKNGRYIYKNSTYQECVGEVPYVTDPKAWKISLSIMNEKKRRIVEESYAGKHYLSIKSPLMIDGQAEGVIGIAVDITERKRLEELEKQIDKQIEFYELGKMANDIGTPIQALKVVEDMYKDTFGEREKKLFEFSLRTIKDIGDRLM
jgi:transcriptional regulator with PAS, ATPase and Fis domain